MTTKKSSSFLICVDCWHDLFGKDVLYEVDTFFYGGCIKCLQFKDNLIPVNGQPEEFGLYDDTDLCVSCLRPFLCDIDDIVTIGHSSGTSTWSTSHHKWCVKS